MAQLDAAIGEAVDNSIAAVDDVVVVGADDDVVVVGAAAAADDVVADGDDVSASVAVVVEAAARDAADRDSDAGDDVDCTAVAVVVVASVLVPDGDDDDDCTVVDVVVAVVVVNVAHFRVIRDANQNDESLVPSRPPLSGHCVVRNPIPRTQERTPSPMLEPLEVVAFLHRAQNLSREPPRSVLFSHPLGCLVVPRRAGPSSDSFVHRSDGAARPSVPGISSRRSVSTGINLFPWVRLFDPNSETAPHVEYSGELSFQTSTMSNPFPDIPGELQSFHHIPLGDRLAVVMRDYIRQLLHLCQSRDHFRHFRDFRKLQHFRGMHRFREVWR